MKKGIKAFLIIVMLFGIAFSISNFISVEIEAAGSRGVWVDLGSGIKDCTGDGDECNILGFSPKD